MVRRGRVSDPAIFPPKPDLSPRARCDGYDRTGPTVRRVARLLAFGATCAALPLGAQEGAPPFTIAQLQYDGGGDWYANPSALPNLLTAIHDRTGIPVALGPRVDIRLTDPRLRDFPYVYLTGHGNISLTDREVLILREYLLEGGFLHADDNYGLDESFRREISSVRRLTKKLPCAWMRM